MKVQIVFEDEEILVCHKPSGVPTQTAKLGTQDLVSLLKNELYRRQKEKGEPYLAVIHRLDQPVEGLLVFAKTASAAKALNAQLQKSGGFGKHYQAIVCGVPPQKAAVLENYLVKDGRSNISRVCTSTEPGGKKAKLSYRVLESFWEREKEYSLLHIELDTGRHHQIRVQMAEMGCPIVGDRKYGRQDSIGKLALCAYQLEFLHPKTKKSLSFTLPGLDKREVFQ